MRLSMLTRITVADNKEVEVVGWVAVVEELAVVGSSFKHGLWGGGGGGVSESSVSDSDSERPPCNGLSILSTNEEILAPSWWGGGEGMSQLCMGIQLAHYNPLAPLGTYSKL